MSLDFFNSLSGKLDIELSEPTEDIAAELANQRATSTAEIANLALVVEVWEGDARFRAPTAEELQRPALMEPQVTLRGSGDAVTHRAPNRQWFTVEELLAAVVETERLTRHQKRWFDGIDVHHVYFEGIEFGADGVGEISWGS